MPCSQRFIDHDLYRINGFLHPVDAMALAGLAGYQLGGGVLGAMMEIGVFYGRSAALMGRYLRPDERFVASDLFDINESETGESEQLTAFRETMRRSGISPEALIVLQGDSARLDPAEILGRAGPIRLMSIDGGHEEHHVRSDAALAAQVVSADGVIVFDDFFNAQYPDVTVAALKALETVLSGFSPFLITRNKLYTCRREHLGGYRTAARDMPVWAGANFDAFRFLGEDILFLSQSQAHQALYQIAAERGAGWLARTALKAGKARFAR